MKSSEFLSANSRIYILGCGPAGASVALGLKKLGYSVIVINILRRNEVFEGISFRTVETLKLAGLSSVLQSPLTPSRRVAFWGGETTSANLEMVVSRQEFDQALAKEVSGQGIEIIEGKVSRLSQNNTIWNIQYSTRSGDKITVEADFVVDARGRSATLPLSKSTRGPSTLALRKIWHFSQTTVRSAVISFKDGWCWIAAFKKDLAAVQIFLTKQAANNKTDFQQLYEDYAQHCMREMGFKAHSHTSSQLEVCSAGNILANSFIEENLIRVGDTAMALDPLSGHGIYKALSCGLSAIPVINTLLQKPENTELAILFYKERLKDNFFHSALLGKEFYVQEQSWPESIFWQQRNQWPDDPVINDMDRIPVITKRPASSNGFIVEKPVVVTGDNPRGIWHMDNVPLVKLAELLIGNHSEDPDTLDNFAQENQASRAAMDRAAIWLKSQGLI